MPDRPPIGNKGMSGGPPPTEEPLDYGGSGWARTGRLRLSPGWFGFVKVEELWQSHAGDRQWCTVRRPIQLNDVTK